MCGILCIVSCSDGRIDCSAVPTRSDEPQCCDDVPGEAPTAAAFQASLLRRGPDAVDSTTVVCGDVAVELHASLLQLRGTDTCVALKRLDGCFLCYNGEVFDGVAVRDEENDGDALCASLVSSRTLVPGVLSRLRGPWSLVFLDSGNGVLWFGRDIFGRRSLLLRRPTEADSRLLLASTAPLDFDAAGSWIELPPGMYSLDMFSPDLCIRRHEWTSTELRALSPYRRILGTNGEDEVLQALDHAVKVRVSGQLGPLLILFSGGLDSTLLACLAHRHLDTSLSIDLCNVCFSDGASADRQASRLAAEELRHVSPGRLFRLIEVNATLADVDADGSRLARLLKPASTLMDRNIGAALHLAAQGRGLVNGQLYHSPSRVVLLGTGADEQAGGYGRHRTAFRNGGVDGLVAELEADVNRLWLRNLGRDDRLVSDVSREARFPFLDERVVHALATVPMDGLADLTQPVGIGDKLVLRNIARTLGLHHTAARAKRAIQFGSGLARASNVQIFGSGNQANKRHAGTFVVADS